MLIRQDINKINIKDAVDELGKFLDQMNRNGIFDMKEYLDANYNERYIQHKLIESIKNKDSESTSGSVSNSGSGCLVWLVGIPVGFTYLVNYLMC